MKFRENVPLSQFNSYRIGGPARYFFEASSVAELKDALKTSREQKLKFFVLGGGTNLLVGDAGFGGLVLKPSINFLKSQSETVEVGAGVQMANLLNFTIENGLSGLEWAGGLPGTVGGAVRGNAGAFGGEIKDVVQSVKSLDTKALKEEERRNAECRFAYRSSVFKEENGKEIIVSAVLKLKKGDPKAIRKAVQEKIDYRKARHPMDHPNIGSIFKNIDVEKMPLMHLAAVKEVMKTDPFPVVPTAHLISEAGLKGVSFGGAQVSPKHPNFIVNVLTATAAEVKDLIAFVKGEVKKRFGVELEEEVIQV